VARARRLGAIWVQLDTPPKADRDPLHAAIVVAPGRHRDARVFTAVTMTMTKDRDRLEVACCDGILAVNQALIRREQG
jgi:hypothetical protein